MLAQVIAAVVFAASAALVDATTPIRLENHCSFAVGMTVSSYPGNQNGISYGGAPQISIGAGQQVEITLPNGWNGRICDKPPNSGCENDCWGGIAFGKAACSMTEWKFDGTNNRDYYDISNIQGYSVKQTIYPWDGACSTKSCDNTNCSCNQAYRPGDTSGTCGGTGPLDQAVANCQVNTGYTVVYC